MMTFIFAEKNGDMTVTLSAKTHEEAENKLKETLIDPYSFRLHSIEDDEDEFHAFP
jgi:hypothetical protein